LSPLGKGLAEAYIGRLLKTKLIRTDGNGSMASFKDLGLREPLLLALEDLGVEAPTALQQAAIPVLRREGNLVARAGSGSGKTLAYALGVLDRIEPRADAGDDEEGEATVRDDEGGTRVLVLVATPELAEYTALALVPFAHAVELTIAVTGAGWGTAAGEADVLVSTPSQVMDAVRASGVKLHALEAVVVDGASDIEALAGWESMESIFDNVPRTAQRVVVTGTLTDGVADLIDRRVKRAIRWPTQTALADQAEVVEVTGVVGYVVVSEREKVDVVARVLSGERGGDAPPMLVCRTEERAAQVAEALALRGFLVGDPDDEDADVALVGSDETLAGEEGEGAPAGTVISYDVPADEASLRARHSGEHTGFVLVQPRELPHLREVAARGGLEARPAGVTGEEAGGRDELRRFRGLLRQAIRDEDLSAQMLVLEPLFDEFTAAEVAAAAAALLRRKQPSAPADGAGGASAAPAAPAARASASEAGPPRRERPVSTTAPARRTDAGPAPGGAAYTRLFVGVGERDGVRPGDLVGAIAGESDISGTQVGRIDIRDTFSIVEVPADVAQRVIESVNGITIKGRNVRVDYDRGGDKARRPGPGGGGGGGDRRPTRPGPGGPRGAGPRGTGGPPRGGGDRPGPRGPRRDGGGDRTIRRPPRDRD
jgi:ATP-dependent RNA helicase DeaD